MSSDNRNDILNDIAILLPQGGNCRQDSFRKAGAIMALIAKTPFPLQDYSPQGSLGPIIGRLYPWYQGKGVQCWPELQDLTLCSSWVILSKDCRRASSKTMIYA